MHPSSRRVGPTNARNSASRNGSCPSRALSKTTSVTAPFGSFPSLDAPRLRGLLVPALRLPPDFLAARLAIRPGLYSNPAKTPAPRTGSHGSETAEFGQCAGTAKASKAILHVPMTKMSNRPRHLFDAREGRNRRGRSQIARYFSSFIRPAFKLSKFKIVFRTKEYVPRVSPR
jgi:hypothetical protein